jgi:8-hydroxy-5-deazaflavin:NADPH oxidoreductase
MKISIIGTGNVGQTFASRLIELGHEVMIGTRNVQEKLSSTAKDMYGNPPFSEWIKLNTRVKLGSFEEAGSFGEMILNATLGGSSIAALKLAGSRNLSGKILIDVSNPLDYSKGMPPSLLPELQNTNSLGEEIQKTFPETRVVKTMNTMWCGLMVRPGLIGNGDHTNYISGNDPDAKTKVKKLLNQFGWKDENILDLGDISASRATESVMTIWLRVWGSIQTGAFNFRLIR